MSPASRSKSKDKRAGKEPPQKASAKPAGHANPCNGVPVSGYNPLLGKFHTFEVAPLSSASPLHINGRFRNIDETDDHSGNSLGTGVEYDTVSNNGSCSGESEDHKEKTSHPPHRQEAMPVADNDKREKIRQKNEKKHQRQKEKRAQELHERCSGFLMSRKLQALALQLVSMGFSSERAMMALILNEGNVEESVTWLLEGGKEADDHQELDDDNLKIDISEELDRIADMEIRFKCSKQEVERAIVACEGDLENAAETLRVQKQYPPAVPPKPEETGDPPTVSNGKLSISGNQNSLSAQQKPNPYSTVQQRSDEKDFNYAKTTVTVGVPMESGGKNVVQAVRKVQPKLEGAKAQQITVAADKRWQGAVSSPVSYSLASPLQVSPPLAKIETRYTTLGSELKNLQMGSMKEPVVVMQRPQSQSANVKQAPTSTTSVISSPPGTTSGWFPNIVEVVKPTNGLSPHISSTRTLAHHNNSSSNQQLYNQLHYQHHHQPQQQQQQQQQFGSNNGALDSQGTSRGNGLWNRMVTSPTLSAASSLGLFSGLGSNGSSGPGSSTPLDWNTSGSMLQLDYTNIDWTLDQSSSMSRSSGMFQGVTSPIQNTRIYDSYTSGPSALANGGGGGGNDRLGGLHDGVTSAEMSAAGSREWSSPFEEKDLFSLPRQFVSSPSL
ncbi:NEDD8 ultimate buster like [Actinidia chinensis var. chinensis]|uniref:NEDD8 ultimate buster like n=1 Tax=Actinidia chinensis var. chinensis TaxID=1590841 RepID=A0A2R6R6J2_ACTCC|nr:NEDD8 ultimate buster like [Actinidia chinensis var. chinensis]